MSPARRRQLILALAVVALGALTIMTGRESQRAAPPSPIPTTDNPGPQGLEAALLYLSSRGSARALDEPFTAIPAEARVIITALPYASPVSPEEREALLRWIDGGGTLVVLAQHARGLGGALNGVLDPAFVALHVNGREVGLVEIGKDVKSLLDSASHPSSLDVIPARPAMLSPLLAGVHVLALAPGRGFDDAAGPAVPLAVAGDTPVLLAQSQGAGQIIALAGPDIFTNARVDLGDNLQLLANLGALGPVLFDEGHHRETATVSALALAHYLGPALAAAFVGALLLVLSAGRRLGPVATASSIEKRSTRDYATQLGRLYKRANAEPALAGDLLRELRTRARERAQLPASAEDLEVSRRLEQNDAARAARFLAVCAALEAAERAPGGRAGFLQVARDAAALRRDL